MVRSVCQTRRGVVDYRRVDEVTPNEIGRSLGVIGLTFRNWLHAEKVAGHSVLAAYEPGAHYSFTRGEAAQLAAEYRRRRARPTRTPAPRPPTRPAAAGPGRESDLFAGLTISADPGHRVTETWMGEQVPTLADLLRPGLQAVTVGINPSPVSVAAGHYYQGVVGKRFLARLGQAGVVDLAGGGFEDDQAFAQGIGFTDAVKRPTARANGLRPGELQHGRELLEARLAATRAPRVIFTFKRAAVALLGAFDGHGLIAGKRLGGAEVFVMPVPMERADRVERALRDGWGG